MSLLCYFKPTSSTGLPDPRSSLSQVIPARSSAYGRGRPLLLGSDIDKMVQIYLRKLRGSRGVISRIAISAAKGILLACDKAGRVRGSYCVVVFFFFFFFSDSGNLVLVKVSSLSPVF